MCPTPVRGCGSSRHDVRVRVSSDVMPPFKVGDEVALRNFPATTRGTVVAVADDMFVSVKRSVRFAMEGRESTHRRDDLVRVERLKSSD